MKRSIALLLCLMLILAAPAGCSGEKSDTSSSSNPADSSGAQTSVTDNSQPAEYKIGETWTVEGQWELTVTGLEETADRNEYYDKDPGGVYIVSFTYKNIGYVDSSGIMDGLYFNMEDTIIDCEGEMGYSYPGDITDYPQETPVGATCKGQACIGVEHAGTPIKIMVTEYDGNDNKQTATFVLE